LASSLLLLILRYNCSKKDVVCVIKVACQPLFTFILDLKMNMNFNELEWHDAELLDIYIDRSMAGNNDIVKLTIKQPNDIKVIAVIY